jgi:uncharacterized membrane protein
MHMFYNGGYSMGGMPCFRQILWILLIGVLPCYGWRRSNNQRQVSRETLHQVLQRRLVSGEVACLKV